MKKRNTFLLVKWEIDFSYSNNIIKIGVIYQPKKYFVKTNLREMKFWSYVSHNNFSFIFNFIFKITLNLPFRRFSLHSLNRTLFTCVYFSYFEREHLYRSRSLSVSLQIMFVLLSSLLLFWFFCWWCAVFLLLLLLLATHNTGYLFTFYTLLATITLYPFSLFYLFIYFFFVFCYSCVVDTKVNIIKFKKYVVL